MRELRKQYVQRRAFSRRQFTVTALDGVNLRLEAGRTLVLMGPSGAGKSTLARCIAGLEEPTSGEVRLAGERPTPCAVQVVFQDPAASFNPGFTALEAIAEPLAIQGRLTRRERAERAGELMEGVGLPRSAVRRRAAELSGGQRQRLALARALALGPRLLILDETLSGLDLSTQAQMLNLLLELRQRYALACLYICHDLRLAARIADRVAVLERGRIVEGG